MAASPISQMRSQRLRHPVTCSESCSLGWERENLNAGLLASSPGCAHPLSSIKFRHKCKGLALTLSGVLCSLCPWSPWCPHTACFTALLWLASSPGIEACQDLDTIFPTPRTASPGSHSLQPCFCSPRGELVNASSGGLAGSSFYPRLQSFESLQTSQICHFSPPRGLN